MVTHDQQRSFYQVHSSILQSSRACLCFQPRLVRPSALQLTYSSYRSIFLLPIFNLLSYFRRDSECVIAMPEEQIPALPDCFTLQRALGMELLRPFEEPELRLMPGPMVS